MDHISDADLDSIRRAYAETIRTGTGQVVIGVDVGHDDKTTIVAGFIDRGVTHITGETTVTKAPVSRETIKRISDALLENAAAVTRNGFWVHRNLRVSGNAKQRRHARRLQRRIFQL